MLINCFWFLQSFDWFELGEKKKTTRNKNININETLNITEISINIKQQKRTMIRISHYHGKIMTDNAS